MKASQMYNLGSFAEKGYNTIRWGAHALDMELINALRAHKWKNVVEGAEFAFVAGTVVAEELLGMPQEHPIFDFCDVTSRSGFELGMMFGKPVWVGGKSNILAYVLIKENAIIEHIASRVQTAAQSLGLPTYEMAFTFHADIVTGIEPVFGVGCNDGPLWLHLSSGKRVSVSRDWYDESNVPVQVGHYCVVDADGVIATFTKALFEKNFKPTGDK